MLGQAIIFYAHFKVFHNSSWHLTNPLPGGDDRVSAPPARASPSTSCQGLGGLAGVWESGTVTRAHYAPLVLLREAKCSLQSNLKMKMRKQMWAASAAWMAVHLRHHLPSRQVLFWCPSSGEARKNQHCPQIWECAFELFCFYGHWGPLIVGFETHFYQQAW